MTSEVRILSFGMRTAIFSLLFLVTHLVIFLLSAEERLERDLKYLGEHLVDGLYLPICGATDSHHCIVRLLPQESIPLHSKARVTLPASIRHRLCRPMNTSS